MTQDVSFSCDCGKFKARLVDVSPKRGTHIKCHCRDCQAFIHFTDHAATALGANSGVAIFQTRPSRFEILQGADQLAAVHLSDKETLRWYTSCCKTPIGTTLATSAVPFLGLVTYGLDKSIQEQALGPSLGSLHLEDTSADTAGLKKANMPKLMATIFTRVLFAKLAGKKEKNKNPLFKPEDGLPIVEPYRLSADKRKTLETKIDAHNNAA